MLNYAVRNFAFLFLHFSLCVNFDNLVLFRTKLSPYTIALAVLDKTFITCRGNYLLLSYYWDFAICPWGLDKHHQAYSSGSLKAISRPKQSFHLEMECDFELGTQKQKDFNFYCSEPFTTLQLVLLWGGKMIIVKYKAKFQHLLPAWFCCCNGSWSNW